MAGYRAFLFPEAKQEGDRMTLCPRESHHLSRVLRARTGDSVEVLSGRGRVFVGLIESGGPSGLELRIVKNEQIEAQRPALTLVQALPKGKTMDLILRMATEIGVARVCPVFTDQSEVRMEGKRLAAKVEKWRTTMIESCKQCGLPFLPELTSPVVLSELLSSEPAARDKQLRVVASLESGSLPLREVLAKEGAGIDAISVAVGPEGDFSTMEYADLAAAGYKPVRLGANVLRAETAAAYLLSVVDQNLRAGLGASGEISRAESRAG